MSMAGTVRYGGFWRRSAAFLVDVLLVSIIAVPVLYWAYGAEYFSQLGEDDGKDAW